MIARRALSVWTRLAILPLFGTLAFVAACDDGASSDPQAPANAPVADENAVSEGSASDADFLPACLGERLPGKLVKGFPYATLAVGAGSSARTPPRSSKAPPSCSIRSAATCRFARASIRG